MRKVKALFLCTGNSARSQMAEAFLRQYAGDHFEAFSAGLEPRGINPYTLQVMREVGIDLSQQASKHLDQFLGKTNFDYVITVCDQAEKNCPFFPGATTRLHWSFEDPAAFQGNPEERLAKFREIRDQIEAQLRVWLASQGFKLKA